MPLESRVTRTCHTSEKTSPEESDRASLDRATTSSANSNEAKAAHTIVNEAATHQTPPKNKTPLPRSGLVQRPALTGPPPINIDFRNDATGGSASNALFGVVSG